MPARTRARAGPTPACRPRPRARAPSVRTALGRGSVRSRRPDPGPAERSAPPRPGSSTSRRTIVSVSSTRTTIAPSDAPLWHTPLVTSSDTTSSASSRTNAGTRPRKRPTTIRAAPGARPSSGKITSSAPPSRAAPSPPWRPIRSLADRNSAFSALSAAAPLRKFDATALSSSITRAWRRQAKRKPSSSELAPTDSAGDRGRPLLKAPSRGCIGTASRNPPRRPAIACPRSVRRNCGGSPRRFPHRYRRPARAASRKGSLSTPNHTRPNAAYASTTSPARISDLRHPA